MAKPISLSMVQLKAFELLFQLSYLSIVCTYSRVAWLHWFHDMVNDQLGGTPHQEPPHPHLTCDPELVDEGLIFSDIVGGVEVEVDGVVKLVFLRRCEDDTRTASCHEVGPIEVHGPVLRIFDWGRLMRLCPLYNVLGMQLMSSPLRSREHLAMCPDASRLRTISPRVLIKVVY